MYWSSRTTASFHTFSESNIKKLSKERMRRKPRLNKTWQSSRHFRVLMVSWSYSLQLRSNYELLDHSWHNLPLNPKIVDQPGRVRCLVFAWLVLRHNMRLIELRTSSCKKIRTHKTFQLNVRLRASDDTAKLHCHSLIISKRSGSHTLLIKAQDKKADCCRKVLVMFNPVQAVPRTNAEPSPLNSNSWARKWIRSLTAALYASEDMQAWDATNKLNKWEWLKQLDPQIAWPIRAIIEPAHAITANEIHPLWQRSDVALIWAVCRQFIAH